MQIELAFDSLTHLEILEILDCRVRTWCRSLRLDALDKKNHDEMAWGAASVPGWVPVRVGTVRLTIF